MTDPNDNTQTAAKDNDEERVWSRRCDECSYIQRARRPNQDHELTDAYRNAECRKCHSSALDYGQYRDRVIIIDSNMKGINR